MADLTDAQFRQKVIDVLNEKGSHIADENDVEHITSVDEFGEDGEYIMLPGYKTDEEGDPVKYFSASLKIFCRFVRDKADSIRSVWDSWFGTSDASGVQGEWKTLKADSQKATSEANTAAGNANDKAALAQEKATLADTAAGNADTSRQAIEQNEQTRQYNETTRQSNETTRRGNESQRQQNETTRQQNETTRQGNEDTRKANELTRQRHETAREEQASSDHTQAERDHAAAVEATDEASNVNAQLEGMTVTITNRKGVSREVNIGFEILERNVYPSVAAMQADADNVQAGKFCMVATTDPTSEDNSRLYSKNSAGGFTFLSDLDQAASHAWADWLENHKQQIQQATDYANGQGDYAKAQGDNAKGIWETVNDWFGIDDSSGVQKDWKDIRADAVEATDNANEQADYAKNMADHPSYVSDGTAQMPGDAGYVYHWSHERQQYVRGAKLSLDWESMNEEQKEALSEKVLEQLTFTAPETCEAIVDELL